MKLSDALIALKITDASELQDAFENAVFTIKKELISKPLLKQTAAPRMKKLKELAEIESCVEFSESKNVDFQPILKAESNVMNLWIAYQADKNLWKQKISECNSVSNLIEIINNGLLMELHYSSQFPAFDWTDEKPVFGSEPDVMMVQKQLIKAADASLLTFELLYKCKNHLNSKLLLALKRLSLLPKFLRDDTRSV